MALPAVSRLNHTTTHLQLSLSKGLQRVLEASTGTFLPWVLVLLHSLTVCGLATQRLTAPNGLQRVLSKASVLMAILLVFRL